jgi:hypothetical protein
MDNELGDSEEKDLLEQYFERVGLPLSNTVYEIVAEYFPAALYVAYCRLNPPEDIVRNSVPETLSGPFQCGMPMANTDNHRCPWSKYVLGCGMLWWMTESLVRLPDMDVPFAISSAYPEGGDRFCPAEYPDFEVMAQGEALQRTVIRKVLGGSFKPSSPELFEAGYEKYEEGLFQRELTGQPLNMEYMFQGYMELKDSFRYLREPSEGNRERFRQMVEDPRLKDLTIFLLPMEMVKDGCEREYTPHREFLYHAQEYWREFTADAADPTETFLDIFGKLRDCLEVFN